MRIAVLGARGHTGRLVVPALEARGVEARALGRDADVTDRAALRRALADADGAVNLAGPFTRTGFLPIETAIERRIPYADTTGEQAFMREARQRYHARAEAAGVAVVNALAYEYALADLAVGALMPEGGRALHVLYRSRGARGSAGTKKSALRVFAGPAWGHEDGALRRVATGAHVRRFRTKDGARDGVSFPGGEALTVPRHASFATIRSYVPGRPSRARAARVLSPLARAVLRGPVLAGAERLIDARHEAPDNARVQAEIHLVTEDPARHVVLHVGDPYRATAEVCAEGITRLVGGKARGVLAPSEALPAGEVLAALQRRLPEFHVTTLDPLGEKKK